MSPLVVAGDDFASWQRQMMEEFQEFKDERDREFTEFLKAHWKEMKLLEGIERDKTPKPRVVPKKSQTTEPPQTHPSVATREAPNNSATGSQAATSTGHTGQRKTPQGGVLWASATLSH